MNNQDNALMERKPFLLPDCMGSGGDDVFTKEDLKVDIDGLQLGFQRIKIPSGGQVQFELPGKDPDNPEYTEYLEGAIVYSHSANSFWASGKSDNENTPPDCQSTDGKVG